MGILVCSFIVPPYLSIVDNKAIETIENNIMLEGNVIDFPILSQTVKNNIDLVKQSNTEIIENIINKEVDDYVYTTEHVNIQTYTDIESNILLTAEAGTKLHRIRINVIQGWDVILINEEKYYISNECLTLDEPAEIAKTIEEQLEDSYINAEDLRYMSAIIWAEAGNQCEAGQQAVGIVVMNRVASETYKDTIYDVINEPYQFSPVSNGSFIKALNYYDSGDISESIVNAAKYALKGNKTVNYNGEIYNLDGYLYFSRWINNSKLIIQDHMFK